MGEYLFPRYVYRFTASLRHSLSSNPPPRTRPVVRAGVGIPRGTNANQKRRAMTGPISGCAHARWLAHPPWFSRFPWLTLVGYHHGWLVALAVPEQLGHGAGIAGFCITPSGTTEAEEGAGSCSLLHPVFLPNKPS
jgi:hypothetical protein